MKLEIKAKNYTPESMSFAAGFFCTRTGDFAMFVDNEKSHKIIKQLLSQGKQIESAELGLDGDFNCNSTTVFSEGDFFNYDAHEGSLWAEPILVVNYLDGSNEVYSCWYRNIETTGVVSASDVECPINKIEYK